jgi:hypothetical protein
MKVLVGCNPVSMKASCVPPSFACRPLLNCSHDVSACATQQGKREVNWMCATGDGGWEGRISTGNSDLDSITLDGDDLRYIGEAQRRRMWHA